MAVQLYRPFKQGLFQFTAAYNMTSGTVKAVLVDASQYTFTATHQYRTSLAGVMKSSGATDAEITIDNKTFTDGTFDTTDATDTFGTCVASTSTYENMVLFIDTGTPSTSPLLAHLDLPSAVRPNGGAIIFDWDDITSMNGASGGIFAL